MALFSEVSSNWAHSHLDSYSDCFAGNLLKLVATKFVRMAEVIELKAS